MKIDIFDSPSRVTDSNIDLITRILECSRLDLRGISHCIGRLSDVAARWERSVKIELIVMLAAIIGHYRGENLDEVEGKSKEYFQRNGLQTAQQIRTRDSTGTVWFYDYAYQLWLMAGNDLRAMSWEFVDTSATSVVAWSTDTLYAEYNARFNGQSGNGPSWIREYPSLIRQTGKLAVA